MKQFQMKVQVDDELLAQHEQLVNQLLNDPNVLDACQRANINTEWISRFPFRIKKWYTNVSLCRGCTGLAMCKQENKGKFYQLRDDGQLEFYIQSCKYLKEHEEKRSHLSRFAVNDMPSTLVSMCITDLEITQSNFDAFNQVKDWLLEPNYVGFYIRGEVGVGKSTLAACACNHMAKQGKWVAYVNVPSWIARMKNNINDSLEFQRQLTYLQHVDFLVLDDIGAEAMTAWSRDEVLFPVLNKRMEEKRMTWFTSNEDLNSLLDHYRFTKQYGDEELKAHRFMERVKTLCKDLLINGQNRRNRND